MAVGFRIALILLAGASFIFAHEGGHWLAAQFYGLNPGFVWSGASSGLLGLAIGVVHEAANPIQQLVIILGATLLPLSIAIIFAGLSHFSRNREIAIVAELYILLIVVNLIPIPGVGQLDANRVWAAVLPPI